MASSLPAFALFQIKKSNEQVGSHSASSPASHRLVELIMLKGYGNRTTLEAENCAFVANKNITRRASSMKAAAAGFGI
jgi:hypothetical protein